MVKQLIAKLKLLALPLGVAVFFVLSPAPAHAAYTDNNLIDDSIFLNSNTMSQADIQNFLNSKGGAIAGYSAPNTDPGQNNRMMSAAEIIYFTSQYVGINPRVIMATLQKEQSLITDPNPSAGKYNYAMGYGCPDSGGCSGSSGFYYQVVTASWQLRLNFERAGGSNAPWTSPSGKTWGTNIGYACPSATRYYSTGLYAGRSVTFYSDNGTAYKTFNLDNRGTASMYCYTPHAYNPSGVPQYYSGSYNFVTSFESWWGSTIATPYAWLLVSQASDTDLSTLQPGQEARLTVVARNTGSVTWTNSGPNPVKLGTTNPQNRNSLFTSSTWPAPGRAAIMTETSVAPGANATFTFTIKAPNNAGTYAEYFSLLAENLTWFNDPGMYFYVTVRPTYTWSMQSQSSDFNLSVLPVGQKATLTLKALNTGSATWRNYGDNPVKVGTSGPNDRNSGFATTNWNSGTTRAALMTEREVPPGGIGTFIFEIQAPNNTGQKLEGFSLVAEGLTWFNDPGVNYAITVIAPVRVASVSVNRFPVGLGVNSTTSFVQQFRNDGNVAWYRDGKFPVTLASGTSSQPNQSNVFHSSSWLSDTVVARLDQAVVSPGEQGTFTIQLSAPASPSIFSQSYSLLFASDQWSTSNLSTTVNVLGQFNSTASTQQNTNLMAGASSSVTISFLNTGTQTWSKTGAFQVNLGTSSPIDRQSPFYDSSWPAPTRPATLNELTVAPGQTGTFTFRITTKAGQNGLYQERFSLVSEGWQWFGGLAQVNVNVAAPVYGFGLEEQAAYTDSTKSVRKDLASLSPGDTAWLVLKARNTGNIPWDQGGAFPVHLGTESPRDRQSKFSTQDWPAPTRPAVLKEVKTDPGEIGTFEFPISIPGTGGIYFERFNLVVEGRQWMPDIGLGYYMNVSNKYAWQLVSQYAYTDATKQVSQDLSSLSPGQSYLLGMRAKNTGTATWRNTGTFPVMLGTSSPNDRQSVFAAPSWPGPTRPASLKEITVAPGEVGTFEFITKAPSAVGGPYFERLNLLAEGLTWMPDIGLGYYIVVK